MYCLKNFELFTKIVCRDILKYKTVNIYILGGQKMIDLTINKENLERNIKKAKENKIVIPTYEQMKHPETIPGQDKG